jgi:chemotaxis protein methyltransferase CheR
MLTEIENKYLHDNGLPDAFGVGGVADAVSMHTGLNLREKDSSVLHKVLKERMKANGVSSVSEYLKLVEGNTKEAKRECAGIIVRMTVGESYFFRDRGQLALLRDVILPGCIARNKESRVLRILSAGCSTGEEPYTLAMLIDELIPAKTDWNITILGVDVNDESIRYARRGVYTDWSLRVMDDQRKKKYFTHSNEGWELNDAIKKMVQFITINLLNPDLKTANPEIDKLDLVLCRNVFIYLNNDAISLVLSQLTGALSEGGCLVTGHGELYAIKTEHLSVQTYPDSVVYRKTAGAPCDVIATTWSEKKKIDSNRAFTPVTARPLKGKPPGTYVKKNVKISPQKTPTSKDAIQADLIKLFLSGNYSTVIKKSQDLIEQDHSILWAYHLIARSYANCGDKASAAEMCRIIIERDITVPEPYFLLAQIHEGNGDTRGAIELLKKVIYLAPDFPAAYVELAALYDGEGDRKMADRMYRNALELLDGTPGGDIVPFYEHMTAGELRDYIRNGIIMAGEKGDTHGK